jgi:hypothetical protein
MESCLCGCGETVPTSVFKPGHDQRLRIGLENRVGGIQGMRELVNIAERYASGQATLEEFAGSVRAIFWRTQRPNSEV